MATKQQRDPRLETVNKKEVVNAIGNALNHFIASQELQDLIDARVKVALAVETTQWRGLFGEGAADPYPGYKPQLPESSL